MLKWVKCKSENSPKSVSGLYLTDEANDIFRDFWEVSRDQDQLVLVSTFTNTKEDRGRTLLSPLCDLLFCGSSSFPCHHALAHAYVGRPNSQQCNDNFLPAMIQKGAANAMYNYYLFLINNVYKWKLHTCTCTCTYNQFIDLLFIHFYRFILYITCYAC